MAGGSRQLRTYRTARAAGDTREEAATVAGISLGEAALIDADDARDQPQEDGLPLRQILIGDALTELRKLPSDSVDCCVTSPPYWGLRDYGVDGQLGMERSLGEHIAVMVEIFREVRRILKPSGTCWINYGDCYATTPNGRSAADTKSAGDDDRTFRDKPFSTVGPIYDPQGGLKGGGFRGANKGNAKSPDGRVVAGGYLKPKDLCMVPQRLFIALQEDGWWVRSVLPWIKRNGMPESISDRPANSVEYVAFLTKQPRYFYDAEAVRRLASPNTHARVAQNIDAQAGSLRANGGAKTNGPMKAVVRRPKVAAAGSGIRSNESYEAVMSGAVLHDRNFRNTDLFFDALEQPWGLISDADGTPLALDVTPQAFREAHFATFPPGLIDPLIRTSPECCCSACGKPWARTVTKGEPIAAARAACGADSSGGYSGQGTKDYAAARAQNPSDVKRRILEGLRERSSRLEADCACSAPTIPGVIIDPFFGAGTTGLVADRLQRNWIGIELNPEYAAIARNRIDGDRGGLLDAMEAA